MSDQCRKIVFVKDTLRVSHGRTFSGRRTSDRFTMHYKARQCKRPAKDNGYCRQHYRSGVKP